MSRETPRAAVVEADRLAAAYGRKTIWSDATFAIRPGEFVAVLGPNGAGKSTLMRLLLGLLPPAGGTISVLGSAPHRGNPAIGYVPQRRSIDPETRLAAREFVRLGVDGHRWGIGRPGQRERLAATIREAADQVGATPYLDQPIGTLSGGEQQRLMLAQAIINQPQLLLLDEPLASLDVRNQVTVANLVGSLARSRGLAVLLIAHDVNPLLPVLDRVIYIARGQVTVGTPDEIITSKRLSAIYDSPVEVLRDGRGRLFVVGLDEDDSHHHQSEGVGAERW